jgi:hypothetical protein
MIKWNRFAPDVTILTRGVRSRRNVQGGRSCATGAPPPGTRTRLNLEGILLIRLRREIDLLMVNKAKHLIGVWSCLSCSPIGILFEEVEE